MALNPNIPLAALQGSQRLGNSLAQLGNTVAQTKERNRLADLQERQFSLQENNLNAARLKQAQESRIKEGVFAAQTIQPFIDSGDLPGAINALEGQRKFFGSSDIVDKIQQGLQSEMGLQFGQELVPNFIRRGESLGFFFFFR